MTTKISFLLKQTEEQRKQLDSLATEAGLSRTAYVQRLLDAQWSIKHSELSIAMVELSNAVQKAYATAEVNATKAPPEGEQQESPHLKHCCIGIPMVEFLSDSSPFVPPSCACEACYGNCAGCGKVSE